jgi:hypothetical protein
LTIQVTSTRSGPDGANGRHREGRLRTFIQGTLTLNADGTFAYTADGDATGTDSFTNNVTDSAHLDDLTAAATTTGTVTLETEPTATAT